jgi:hypothetical protein
MFVNVQEVSCETPGIMSNRILRQAMSTRCIVQAPKLTSVLAMLAQIGFWPCAFGNPETNEVLKAHG